MHSMQAEGLLCPACIVRGLKQHEKTGSALNVSAGNSLKMIHIGNCETSSKSFEPDLQEVDVDNESFKT